MFGEGEYTLEVLRGRLSRVKLSQREVDAGSMIPEEDPLASPSTDVGPEVP